MRLRSVICTCGLVLALLPFSAFADESHAQDEMANAEALLVLAQQQANALSAQAAFEATNVRQIAFAKSAALRQKQVDDTANAAALQQEANQLATQLREQGDFNARNALAILQIKASGLVALADAKVANAIAIGHPDEIANAQAQSVQLHQLADFLTGTLAQQDESNAEVIADDGAMALEGNAVAEVQNADAMGADDLFAADTVLEASNVGVSSATIAGEARGAAVIANAEAQVANAEARLDLAEGSAEDND